MPDKSFGQMVCDAIRRDSGGKFSSGGGGGAAPSRAQVVANRQAAKPTTKEAGQGSQIKADPGRAQVVKNREAAGRRNY